jgi:pimeloyl-ACP methyl ester carboxylesterase
MPDYGLPRLRPRDVTAPVTRLLRAPLPQQNAARAERWKETGSTTPRLSPLGLTSAGLDSLSVLAMRTASGRSVEREMAAVLEESRDAVAMYLAAGWLTDARSYHRTPDAPDVQASRFHALGETWERLGFESQWEPHPGEPGSERWESYTANKQVPVRVLRHSGPAPWLVLLHGAFMGRLRTDAPVFDPVRLHRELGYNVVMPVLPLHGRRSAPGGIVPRAIPSFNILDNVHGLAQAAWDVRRLLAWIRTQDDQPVSLYGISLGGYVGALTGALLGDQPAHRIIAGIPAVDFPKVFLSQIPPRAQATSWYDEYARNLVQVHRAVAVLALPPPQTPTDHLHLYAARHDRVLRPLQQATRLWQHWGRPEVLWIDGGHILAARSKRVTRFVGSALSS